MFLEESDCILSKGSSIRVSERTRSALQLEQSFLNSAACAACRLDDGFQLPSAAEPTSGSPGQFLDTGTAKTQPVQEYAVTDPLLLPANFSSVQLLPKLPIRLTRYWFERPRTLRKYFVGKFPELLYDP